MRIGVNSEVCEAHGQCSVVDMDLFPLDDDGYSALGPDATVPEGEEDVAKIGVESCPVRALSVLEEE
ncbi:ferredoxin [Pseudonocardia sediminis]|uniref:Ferredoxin n=1 Tax=Pseudonocardia sediminis TaxID=1397368 RepID=A0A4Q7URZ0_PSEST|nr:ferredoxin [Pseudonocardia sediminis]RZT84512.1 ferredoxin [Pseudonocardia sediminis]